MIRISLVRLGVSALKTAITVSSLFRPAGWKRIAIAHALIGFSFLLIYGFLDRHFHRTVGVQGEALTTDNDAKTDDLFNGFGVKGTPIDECVNEPVAPTARGNGRFEDNKFIFSERETIEDGLGPTYTDVGCVECHQSVDVGAFGQQMEFRAGHITNGAFVDAPGGQLIHARATDSDIIEHISTAETVKAFRVTLSTLGDGFVECLANATLQNDVAAQPLAQRGTLTNVPVTEAGNALRIGRFGWKAQHASLVSFSGDAYLNEMGITNPFDGFGGRSSSAASPEGLRLPSISIPERYVVFQTSTRSGQTLLETVMKLFALFQGITMIINGSLASILGLIAYHRAQLDLKVKALECELKRLQILQIQQQLDKQDRERQKEIEEATRSSIILIN